MKIVRSLTPVLGTALLTDAGPLFGYADKSQQFTLGSAAQALASNVAAKLVIFVDLAARTVTAVPETATGLASAKGIVLSAMAGSDAITTFTPQASAAGTYSKTSVYDISGYNYEDGSGITGAGIVGMDDILPLVRQAVSMASLVNKLEAQQVANSVLIDQTNGTISASQDVVTSSAGPFEGLPGALKVTLPETPSGSLPNVAFE